MERALFTQLCIVIFLAGVFAGPCSADVFRAVATKARTEYAAAQVQWQNDVAELVTRTSPEFTDIASIQRALQLASIEERTRQFRFLLEHDPQRLTVTNGSPQFMNFEWTDENAKALIEADPSYATLQKKISILREKNDQQPDWPKFRTWYREVLSKSKDYETILRQFMVKQTEVEAWFQQYKSD